MRIVLFTINELDFAPVLLEPVINRFADQIIASYVSNTLFNSKALRRRAWFFFRNGYPWCIRGDDWLRFAKQKVLSSKSRPNCRSMSEYLRNKGLREVQSILEIRTQRTRNRLLSHQADVFLFCPFPQIATPKFLAIPRVGTFNVHLGKLPEYRGGLSSFWVLRFGDTSAGATFHEVDTKIDTGQIVDEVRFPVGTKSMKDLLYETCERAGPMVVRGLECIERGDRTSIDPGCRPTGYYFFPAYHDFRDFYRRGCRLV